MAVAEREILQEVPSFGSIAEVIEAQRRKAESKPAELYPRDGNNGLARLEKSVSELIGVGPENLILYNNGMAAIGEALELAHPTFGDVVVYGNQLYGQSQWYLSQELRERGVKPIAVDAGSKDDIAKAIEKHRPKIVHFETVANAPDMSVLTLEFLDLPVLEDVDPLIILDNTAPTSAGLPLVNLLRNSNLRILIVESGTKYFGLNKEMVGIIYSDRSEEITDLRKRRSRRGSLPPDSSVRTLERVIPPSKEEFDKRALQTQKNTFELAKASLEVEGEDFVVVYPNLPTHPSYEYAKRKFPQGAAPFFFIIPISDRLDQYKITQALWDNETVRRFCKLGQSFGFDNTRIWPDDRFPVVRVAGGTEDINKIGLLREAFKEALSKGLVFFAEKVEGEKKSNKEN